MIPEFGSLILALSCGIALLLMVVPFIGVQKNNAAIMQSAYPLTYALFGCILIAELVLVYGLLVNDFSVRYIAQNSNSELPFYYRIAASWGAHEGSLLLWSFLLALWTLAIALSRKKIDPKATIYVLAVMGFVNAGFLLFITFTSNPFARTLPMFPIEGRDLNPLLQDVGLIFHPPLLYMGYVGFSVAFAFAIAALLMGRFDTKWIRWFRPWALVAWIFLTLGILLGSVWAYRELGWGGWWFWDPVENSSLMPWLTGTALIHAILVAEKRGTFKIWTLLLAITTFSLCLIGTFLVRSGILVSVHAFSSDPGRGLFILAFLVLVVGGSFLLFAARGHTIRNKSLASAIFSKDTLVMLGNILLFTATLIVLVGTLFPLVYKQIFSESISVGAPFFNTMFYWLMLPFALCLGIAPVLKWHADEPKRLLPATVAIAVLSAGIACAVSFWGEKAFYWEHLLSMFMVCWIGFFTFYGLLQYLKVKQKLSAVNAGFWGMFIAHMGIAMMIFGISYSHYYQLERTIRMSVGESVDLGRYHFTLKEVSGLEGPNYQGAIGVFNVNQGDRLKAVLLPEKRLYNASKMPMTEAAISSTPTRDLYVALSEQLSPQSWAVRIYFKPFVFWIWIGGLCTALGGILAVFDRRRRKDRKHNIIEEMPHKAALNAQLPAQEMPQ